MKLKFFDRFLGSTQISNFIKIHPLGAELFHANRQTDRQTDMAKLTVEFRNFANTPKNRSSKAEEQNWNMVKSQSCDDQRSVSQSVN